MIPDMIRRKIYIRRSTEDIGIGPREYEKENMNDHQEMGKSWILTELLLLIMILIAWDIIADIRSGVDPAHMLIEGLAGTLVLVGIVIIWHRRILPMRTALVAIEASKRKLELELQQWKESIAPYAQGVQQEIDRQFTAWGLTPAEKETAFLLLKGLSLKEIAEVRGVTEKTVKQHNQAIYQKSSLKGRAELSAFFLEDLLARPTQSPDLRKDKIGS